MQNHKHPKGLVMVIDDEVDTREILGSMLGALDYECLPVKNGKEAIEKYKGLKEKIDLVMLDIFIPQMSGAEIYKELAEVNPDIHVLVISGYGEERSEVQNLLGSLNKTTTDFVVKPFTINTLQQKITKLTEPKSEVTLN